MASLTDAQKQQISEIATAHFTAFAAEIEALIATPAPVPEAPPTPAEPVPAKAQVVDLTNSLWLNGGWRGVNTGLLIEASQSNQAVFVPGAYITTADGNRRLIQSRNIEKDGLRLWVTGSAITAQIAHPSYIELTEPSK